MWKVVLEIVTDQPPEEVVEVLNKLFDHLQTEHGMIVVLERIHVERLEEVQYG